MTGDPLSFSYEDAERATWQAALGPHAPCRVLKKLPLFPPSCFLLVHVPRKDYSLDVQRVGFSRIISLEAS